MARGKRGTKKQRINLISTAIFLSVMIVIAVIYYFVSPDVINRLSKNNGNKNVPQTIKSEIGEGDFVIHFVDVGQGDGILVQLPDGKAVLVDAGTKSNVGKLTDYIDALGITKLDYVIATHADGDHVGGMPTVFDKYEVSYVFRPHVLSTFDAESNDLPVLSGSFNTGKSGVYACANETYYNFLRAVEDEGCDWSFFNKDSDRTFVYTSEETEYVCKFDFLTPTADVDDIAYNKANSYSPIIIIDYCGYKIMLTGDATFAVEDEMLEYYKDFLGELDVDVLKVGHHGSAVTSTSKDFLSAVKPEVGVISCGKNNSYGHPDGETLDNLVEYSHSQIYRTDVMGSIILKVSKEGIPTFDTTKKDYNETDLYVSPTKK